MNRKRWTQRNFLLTNHQKFVCHEMFLWMFLLYHTMLCGFLLLWNLTLSSCRVPKYFIKFDWICILIFYDHLACIRLDWGPPNLWILRRSHTLVIIIITRSLWLLGHESHANRYESKRGRSWTKKRHRCICKYVRAFLILEYVVSKNFFYSYWLPDFIVVLVLQSEWWVKKTICFSRPA